eukprot:CAMPEP_0181502110 /NCGR_PEP_ID=MMETSP1110-20121109/56175_1 /TAXON_ID=174948 /ORGANISM="Symbiodinium sp., Strain CCMP421" /LENGTH=112 /DNA_ID=CAMNT_0023630657 /DNA_START=287 /DNA_END=626 /DNA_ORIENTATION=+
MKDHRSHSGLCHRQLPHRCQLAATEATEVWLHNQLLSLRFLLTSAGVLQLRRVQSSVRDRKTMMQSHHLDSALHAGHSSQIASCCNSGELSTNRTLARRAAVMVAGSKFASR